MNKFINHLLCPFLDVKQKKSTKGINIPVLDGIRGLAVLIVVSSHTTAFCMYGQGSIGVLLFFFLSGFVLIIPFSNNPKLLFQRHELLKYFLNRAFRIIPAYFVIVGGTALILHTSYEWFLWNMSFIKGWNHLWSVAEEVRFYFILPFIIGSFVFFKNRYIHAAILVFLIYISYRYRLEHTIDLMDGRRVQFYFYMFLGGALTYMTTSLPLVNKIFRNKTSELLFTTFALFIFLAFLFTSTEMLTKLWYPLFHNLPANLILNGWKIPHVWLFLFIIFFFSLTFYNTGITKKILESYFFRHMGLLSFSIYLSHMVILKKLLALGFRNEGLFFSVLFVSYLMSLFTYITVEKPFLLLKKKLVLYLHAKESPGNQPGNDGPPSISPQSP
jgi:peptidoglycan/LPS O-acetylase OafA/YrhL